NLLFHLNICKPLFFVIGNHSPDASSCWRAFVKRAVIIKSRYSSLAQITLVAIPFDDLKLNLTQDNHF
ncbi:MAG: hypothetical protein JXB49_34910, partial [Bacteroidales bacterium]|nr:hypothetical protein [Bacteroidales bacterium]